MSKIYFTEKQIQQHSKNPYVQSVSSKGITYTDEIKQLFIAEYQKGKFPKEIFESCGFDIEMIGVKRVHSSGKRWRAAYREKGLAGLSDARVGNSGRPREKELSFEEKYARLEAKTNLLQAENELLKKIRFAERGMK